MKELLTQSRTIAGMEVRYTARPVAETTLAKVLFVGGHFDDEAMAAGVDDELRERGLAVAYAGLTDVSGRPFGNLSPSEVSTLRWQENLVSGEVKRASALYGGLFPDGSLEEHKDDATILLKEISREFEPDIIIAPNPRDPHPDHRAAYQIAVAASDIPVYATDTITGVDYTGKPVYRTHHVSVSGRAAAKSARAYRVHRTQMQVPIDELPPVYQVREMPRRHARELEAVYDQSTYYAGALVFDYQLGRPDMLREILPQGDIFVRGKPQPKLMR